MCHPSRLAAGEMLLTLLYLPVLYCSTVRIRCDFDVFSGVLIFKKLELLEQDCLDAVDPLTLDFQRRSLNGEHLRATVEPNLKLPLIAPSFEILGKADL